MELDWKRDEITKAEAAAILEHACDCLTYINRTLTNPERPHYLWTAFLQRDEQAINDLRWWLTTERAAQPKIPPTA